MFRGAAWFSPSVPRHVRRQWVKYGGKKAGRGRDGIRRRLWYCFCNGPDDPKLPDVRSRGLVPYHALWIAESVKLGRVLSMQDYIIDEPLRPGLDTILRSPKRKPRALTFNPSISSSPYTIGTISDDQDSSILDFTYQDGDTTIDSGDFDESFGSPSRLLDFRKDRENSSSLSWDVTPSLTYEFNDEEMDKSQVEMLIETEELPTAKNSSDWSEMTPEGSYPTNQPPATLELDASAVLSSLSSLYPRALASSTRFIPNVEYGGKTFTAIRKSELKRT